MRALLLVCVLPSLLTAQSATRAGSANNGVSAERLRRVDAYLQQQVDSGRIAGAVGLVLRDGKVVYERAVGWADQESGRRMSADAIDRKSTRLNSSHANISYAVFCLKKKIRP